MDSQAVPSDIFYELENDQVVFDPQQRCYTLGSKSLEIFLKSASSSF